MTPSFASPHALRRLCLLVGVGCLLLSGCDGGPGTAEPAPGEPAPGEPAVSPEPGEPDVCVPLTCDEAGAGCGSLADGCGGILDCGTCAEGLTCGAGAPNVCGEGSCEPLTCDDEGRECGQMSDGCSTVLDCGACDDGTCSPQGVCCAPTTTCDDAECGDIDDGCGHVLNCGGCPAGETCGGTSPNTCSSEMCTPTTCAAVGAECGALSDGCGAVLACGECDAPTTCGGAGVDNQCGATCDLGCPVGFTCSTLGSCESDGGQLTSIDIPAYPVVNISPSVTMNGQTPQKFIPGEDACVRVTFYPLGDNGLDSFADWVCESDGWQMPAATVFAGRYRVDVRSGSNAQFAPNNVTVIEDILLQ